MENKSDIQSPAAPTGEKPTGGVVLTARRDGGRFHPAPELAEVRDSGDWPVVKGTVAQFGDYEAYVLSGYNDVRDALQCPFGHMGPNAANAPKQSLAAQPGFFLFQDGEDHTRVRKTLYRYFTSKNIGSLRQKIQQDTDSLLDAMEQKGTPADLVADYALPLPLATICDVLGVPYADRGLFTSWTTTLADRGAVPAEVLGAAQGLKSYIAGLVSEFRAHGESGNNLLTTLVTEYGDLVTDEEVVGVGMMVLMAGHETTASGIAYGTIALLEHPEQADLLRTDDTVLPMAIEEVLRYLTPAQPHYRRIVEDSMIGGREVKAGENVLVSLLAANFDEALVGDNPDLNISRGLVPHVAFGLGAHQCIGQHLARLELQIALPALLRRFPSLRVDIPKAQIVMHENASIRSIQSLPVSW